MQAMASLQTPYDEKFDGESGSGLYMQSLQKAVSVETHHEE